MLNQPQIERLYYDWALRSKNITVARSLPDLQFTFQLYIQDVITSVMTGLMAQIPWPGKLRVQAEAATAESRAKYFASRAQYSRPPTPSNKAITRVSGSRQKNRR